MPIWHQRACQPSAAPEGATPARAHVRRSDARVRGGARGKQVGRRTERDGWVERRETTRPPLDNSPLPIQSLTSRSARSANKALQQPCHIRRHPQASDAADEPAAKALLAGTASAAPSRPDSLHGDEAEILTAQPDFGHAMARKPITRRPRLQGGETMRPPRIRIAFRSTGFARGVIRSKLSSEDA